MSFRRRHRCARRLVVGLAFGLLVAPAQAKPLPTGPGNGDSTTAATVQVSDPYLTDIASRPVEATASGPDGIAATPLPVATSVRPDDRPERFTVTGGEVAAATDDGFAVDWENGITIGLGALVAALALALAAALRRPRVAL
jgi:hypothetical protein